MILKGMDRHIRTPDRKEGASEGGMCREDRRKYGERDVKVERYKRAGNRAEGERKKDGRMK